MYIDCIICTLCNKILHNCNKLIFGLLVVKSINVQSYLTSAVNLCIIRLPYNMIGHTQEAYSIPFTLNSSMQKRFAIFVDSHASVHICMNIVSW